MRLFFKSFLIFIVVVFLFHSPAVSSDDKKTPASGRKSQEAGSGSNFGSFLASIYRNHISPVDGVECPSLPSCSSYSVAAFKKHGFFVGWMMTVDRLIHEGKEETRVSPVVIFNGKRKILDPLENNDFWWYTPNRKHDE